MKLIFKLILQVTGVGKFVKYVLLGIASGLCSFLFINAVTFVVGLIIAGNFKDINTELILAFFLIVLFFIWIRKTLAGAIINLSQVIFWQLRKQIISLVLKCDYQRLMTFKDRINAVIVNDVITLTQASMNIIEFLTAFILSITCLIYLLYISWVLFLITLAVAVTGIFIYQLRSKGNFASFQKARDYEDQFINAFNNILGGAKEIYIEPLKGRYIYDQKILPISKASFNNNTNAFSAYLTNQITGQVLFYLLISLVLLVFSVKLNIKPGDVVSFVFTLLYLLGSIETIMVILPALVRAMVSANVIMNLKTELEQVPHTIIDEETSNTVFAGDEFNDIVVQNVEYGYHKAEDEFKVGPVDLIINRNSIVFIYGGNGSGKTTFINILLGLITPQIGTISYNDEVITESNYVAYRKKFAVVFSDFYLFGDLYNAGNIDSEKLQFYLKLFELNEKVQITNNQFSTTDLSTGQRKRLALIAALLEGKKLLVLDEWAADQDPYFRKKFYTEILPAIRDEGVTIIAITHDDKYYHCADVLLKMEEGKLSIDKSIIDEPTENSYT